MVKILITADARYPINRKIIRKAVEDTLAGYHIEKIDAEVSVAVVGKRKMRKLSQKFLGDEAKHDVLTFALEEVIDRRALDQAEVRQGFVNPPDEVLRLGDVILCWPNLLAAASADNVMVDEEVYLLACHGVEHLLGEHHD